MPIISNVGRKALAPRLILGGITAVLVLGAATIVVPFIVMLTLSVSSITDSRDFSFYPRYFISDVDLMRKYLAARCSEDISLVKGIYPVEGQEWLNWSQVSPALPEGDDDTQGLDLLAKDWDEFSAALPGEFVVPAFQNSRSNGWAQLDFQNYLDERYENVERYNLEHDSNVVYLSSVNFLPDYAHQRIWYHNGDRAVQDYLEYEKNMPVDFRWVHGINPAFAAFVKFRHHDSIEHLNQAWGTSYQDKYFNDVAFPLERPSQGARRADWDAFVVERYPVNWMEIPGDRSAAYRAFLKKTYKSISEFNETAGTAYASWEKVLFDSKPKHRAEMILWSKFASTLPVEACKLDSPEKRYRDFVVKKHGSVAAAEKAYGVALKSAGIGGITLPLRSANDAYFKDHKTQIRWNFVTENYIKVSRFLLLQDNALKNTIILVVLTVLTALLINPLAAYALSRFKLGYTKKILLFLIATSAFPAEVTAIPQFLMLRDFNMLNTFSALVLPFVANGFWIFMLKGFFDGLPKELYEAALLEGAGEFTMFFKITVPLSTPILALTAFGAFTSAFSSYLWPMIVANDHSMWTLMVTLQQLIAANPIELSMAAIVLVSLPNMIAFLFMQRIILRGIVVPSMH